uniref:Extrinsic protein in photosystem II n=1 Tax=Grammatophora oceanica TaxID=210454 RepID=A0A7S1YKT6_9STRA|mmetsp:Transcript_52262/g.78071  ORF Transcript_52262/g.78071 Transcript_52262/m.78071 type:complete len:203 (+) Transcript_52262:102-710(+)|eukprot:CAMPEP_0194066338 /NCGR_PEP_ID=MMETSP0009_2-20130614/85960_1 /TAXON_ID=210454 /ORGANISM="Grammatophora oceanica, Strain CCMP 410" /LENGTH=202 /DNA_ID=CAMNT_0038719273 /DNA_START=430 /DNA_END=1038 /DNA_ORIENTATION=-
MKLAVFASLVVAASALNTQTRRDMMKGLFSGAAGAAATVAAPFVANAAAGESPRFSIFGVIGDGTAYSEGAAYGSDQSTPVYSPYSVYGEAGKDSVYDPTDPAIAAKKKAIVAESKVRLTKLDKYISRKEWFNVIDELNRYMYETRGAVRGLASSPKQQEAASAFFKAIEETNLAARLRKQDACAAAAADSIAKLDAFTASL